MPTSLPHYGPPCRSSELAPVRLDFGRGGVINGECNVHSAIYYLRWARDVKNYYETHPKQKRYRVVSCGCYNCRQITGGTSYSFHAWGAAWDINCAHNPYQIPKGPHFVHDMPSFMVRLAEDHHLLWGGHFSTVKDPMHFECHAYHKKPVTKLNTHDKHHDGKPGHGKAKRDQRPKGYDPRSHGDDGKKRTVKFAAVEDNADETIFQAVS